MKFKIERKWSTGPNILGENSDGIVDLPCDTVEDFFTQVSHCGRFEVISPGKTSDWSGDKSEHWTLFFHDDYD